MRSRRGCHDNDTPRAHWDLTGLCILIAPICGGLFYRGQLSIKEWLVMSGLMGRCFPARRRGVGLARE